MADDQERVGRLAGTAAVAEVDLAKLRRSIFSAEGRVLSERVDTVVNWGAARIRWIDQQPLTGMAADTLHAWLNERRSLVTMLQGLAGEW